MGIGFNIKIEFHIYINKGKHNVNVRKNTDEFKPSFGDDIIQLAERQIELLKGSVSPSTIQNYQTAIRSLRQYLGTDIPVNKLSQEIIKGFERWLRNRSLCLNTISCYMRSFRSLFKRFDGISQTDLFDSVFTGRTITEKRAIPESNIIKLRNLELGQHSFANLARDLFIFSFYALGMPFVDMAFLKKEQIKDGKLTYYRHKTGQSITIKLEPCMEDILNRYISEERDYVFPLISSSDNKSAYSEYQMKLNRYNRELKKLARMGDIPSLLTSYTPRHTWASLAYNNSIDLHVISKALGHTNPQTTLTYIRQIDDTRLEDANRSIIAKVRERL